MGVSCYTITVSSFSVFKKVIFQRLSSRALLRSRYLCCKSLWIGTVNSIPPIEGSKNAEGRSKNTEGRCKNTEGRSKNTDGRRPWYWKGLNGISYYIFCLLIKSIHGFNSSSYLTNRSPLSRYNIVIRTFDLPSREKFAPNTADFVLEFSKQENEVEEAYTAYGRDEKCIHIFAQKTGKEETTCLSCGCRLILLKQTLKTWSEGCDWISLDYNRNPLGTFVNTALNVLVPYKAWNFLSG